MASIFGGADEAFDLISTVAAGETYWAPMKPKQVLGLGAKGRSPRSLITIGEILPLSAGRSCT